MTTTESTALEAYRPSSANLVPLIDIEYEKTRLQNFRDFVHAALDPNKGHFGKMPGVDRNFLHQPGAEIIYRALEARPRYTVIEQQIDWATDFCYFLVKCEAVHVASDTVMGEAIGACTSLEFAANCSYKVPKNETDGRFVDCPEHGRTRAREWDRGASMICQGKSPQSLSRTLQNTQAKANKRAMVAAVRTLGCVSEMFSQDEEFLPNQGDDGGPDDQARANRPPARQQPARKSAAAAPARPPADSAPAPQRQAPPPAEPAQPAQKSAEAAELMAEVKAAMKDVLDIPGVGVAEAKTFFIDAGLLQEGENLSGKQVIAWMQREQKPAAAWVQAMADRFKPDPIVAEDEPLEGEFTEAEPTLSAEDLPFE